MISYAGGKSRISKWIIPYIPKDIKTYIEPFGGMFWVFFKMDLNQYPNLDKVVYNDLNYLNSNLIKCTKQYDRLYDELLKHPYPQVGDFDEPVEHAERFYKFQKEIYDPNLVITDENSMDIASKYVYVLTQVFSGSIPIIAKFNHFKGLRKCKYQVFMEKLKKPQFREHFDRITFSEGNDFDRCFDLHDNEDAFFYIDPPYWKTEGYYSNQDFDSADHERLANRINNLKGRFALSYYTFSKLDQWYPKEKYTWTSEEFVKTMSGKKGLKQVYGEETLIMNY